MERNTLVTHASGAIVSVTASTLVSLQVFDSLTKNLFEPARADFQHPRSTSDPYQQKGPPGVPMPPLPRTAPVSNVPCEMRLRRKGPCQGKLPRYRKGRTGRGFRPERGRFVDGSRHIKRPRVLLQPWFEVCLCVQEGATPRPGSGAGLQRHFPVLVVFVSEASFADDPVGKSVDCFHQGPS